MYSVHVVLSTSVVITHAIVKQFLIWILNFDELVLYCLYGCHTVHLCVFRQNTAMVLCTSISIQICTYLGLQPVVHNMMLAAALHCECRKGNTQIELISIAASQTYM